MSSTTFRKMRLDCIIAAVEPGMFATCELHDLNGSFGLVINYITSTPGGVIGEEYADPYSEGRVVVV